VRRGELWWANLPDPVGAAPGYRRPVVIIQADSFTDSRIATVVVAATTTSPRAAAAPGNVHLPARMSGLSRDTVINVTQLLTVDKLLVFEWMGRLTPAKLRELDAGLRMALAL
jgi:mRNA interferase MazF